MSTESETRERKREQKVKSGKKRRKFASLILFLFCIVLWVEVFFHGVIVCVYVTLLLLTSRFQHTIIIQTLYS